jgi:hypothetical protein
MKRIRSTDESTISKARTCGTMNVHRRLLIQSEAYAVERARIEDWTLEFKLGARLARSARHSTEIRIVRIPVVVHVVWNTNTQNITDAQIETQIDVLNQDFRRLNQDTNRVPNVWQNLIGDTRIEFFLATVDPGGNQATGITRTQTNTQQFSDDDAVKSITRGGADPWPSNRYLNVWVCRLQGL